MVFDAVMFFVLAKLGKSAVPSDAYQATLPLWGALLERLGVHFGAFRVIMQTLDGKKARVLKKLSFDHDVFTTRKEKTRW